MKGRELIQYILENALENFNFPGFEKEEMKINHVTNEVNSDLVIDENAKSDLVYDAKEAIEAMQKVVDRLENY